MSSTANLTSIWLISRQYRVPILPPPPAPVIGRRENGNLARVSRPIGEDRVSWLHLRLPNVAFHATSGWEPCKVAERTQCFLYSVRGAPIHLNGNPRININPIPAPRTDGTCLVADATHALSRGLGAARARADQRLSAYEVGRWSRQMGIALCGTLRPSPAKNTRIGKVSAGFYCQAALRP